MDPITTPTAPAGTTGTPPPAAQPGVSGGQPAQMTTVPLAALQEERTKRQALQDEVENLKQIVTGLQTRSPQVTATSPAPSTQFDYNREMDELWNKDQRRATQAEIMTAISYVDQVNTHTEGQIEASKGVHADFDKYEKNVKSYLRQLPLEQRAKPGIVEVAYYFAKGQNADALAKAAADEAARRVGEIPGGLPSGTIPVTPPGQAPTLTEDEKKAADLMGLTPEDYMKHRKK